jgi:MFS family permease
VSIVAIISTTYKDEMEKMFGLQQALTGISMIIGPVVGLLLFKIGGFSCIFYVLSVIFFTTLAYLLFRLPADKIVMVTKEPVSWMMLFRVKV